jgi:hypothetical protein
MTRTAGTGELRRPSARWGCLLAGQQCHEAPMRSRPVERTTDPAVSSGTEPATVTQRRRHNDWPINMRKIRALIIPTVAQRLNRATVSDLSSRRESTSSRSCSKKVSNDHKHYPRTTLVQQWYAYQIGPALFLGLESSTRTGIQAPIRDMNMEISHRPGSRLMTQTDLQWLSSTKYLGCTRRPKQPTS